MFTTLSPLLHNVVTPVDPKDLMLTRGAWVKFSARWPETWKWARGKVFEVEGNPELVPYAISYTLPSGDYKNINLNNDNEKLYPEDEGILYQHLIGFKPGEYIIHMFIPSNKDVHRLGQSSMYPDLTSSTLKYLGAFSPGDSPHTAPTLSLYTIKDGPSIVLRPYILESETYDKVTIEVKVNKCRLQEIAAPTPEQTKRGLYVPYYEEFTGNW